MSAIRRTLWKIALRRRPNSAPPLSLIRRRQAAQLTFRPSVEALDAMVLPNVFDWVMSLLPDLSFLAFLVTPLGTSSDAAPVGERPSPVAQQREMPQLDDLVFADPLPTVSYGTPEVTVALSSAAVMRRSSDGSAQPSEIAASEAPSPASLDAVFGGRAWGLGQGLDQAFDETDSPAERVPLGGGSLSLAAEQAATAVPPGTATETVSAVSSGESSAAAVTLAQDTAGPPGVENAPAVAPTSGAEPSATATTATTGHSTPPAETAAAAPSLSAQQLHGALTFEANMGQTDGGVNFLAHAQGYTAFLTPTGVTLASTGADGSGTSAAIQLVGSNPDASATGLDLTQGRMNYFIGNDVSQWVTNVPNYGQVSYADVYPGINLVYHSSNTGGLEYDFRVTPGAHPGAIAFQVQGASSLQIAADGSLIAHTAAGILVQQAPTVYQVGADGQTQAVTGRFVLRSDNTVGFQVGSHDSTRELVIDPALLFSTYLGGTQADEGDAIAVDTSGNAYATGSTDSLNFPTTPGVLMPLPPPGAANTMAFITKLDPTGAMVYSTYLGGGPIVPGALPDLNAGLGIAVDQLGRAYVTGQTNSLFFPTTGGAFQGALGGQLDAFVSVLDPTGAALVYSTYLGGAADDSGEAIAVFNGSAYVTGWTESGAFPVTPGVVQPGAIAGKEAFVAQVWPFGAGPASLVYSTYLGGSGDDSGSGIAVLNGNAYVTGDTDSTNFPTTGGVAQPALGGGGPASDAFVSVIAPGGGAFIYSTYLGGPASDWGTAIAVDSNGNAFVTGVTGGGFFITPGAVQPIGGGGFDAFVTEVSPTDASFTYSTYLGGAGDDEGLGITLAPGAGVPDVVVTGQTNSNNFPVIGAAPGPWWGALNGGTDAFITRLSPIPGVPLTFSGYLGGPQNDVGTGIAQFNNSSYYVVGTTEGAFPTTPGSAQPVFGGGSTDAFVTRLA